jgi:hypothetical protein
MSKPFQNTGRSLRSTFMSQRRVPVGAYMLACSVASMVPEDPVVGRGMFLLYGVVGFMSLGPLGRHGNPRAYSSRSSCAYAADH